MKFVLSIVFLWEVVLGSSPPLTEVELREFGVSLDKIKPHNLNFTHLTRAGFKARYVDRYGTSHTYPPGQPTVKVQATLHVSDTALNKAATIVGLMLKHAPYDVFLGVTRSHGVGVFTKSDGPTAFPEYYQHADTPQCRGSCHGSCAITCSADGRKYSEMAGITNSRSVVLDDNVLCNSRDPYGHRENVLVHEFGHLVKFYMPSNYKSRLDYVFNYAKSHNVWYSTYAMSNADEYWAEATSSFFMTITRPGKTGPAGGMNLCDNFSRVCYNEMESRQHLKQHDPWLYDVLKQVYTNSQDHLASGLRVCQ